MMLSRAVCENNVEQVKFLLTEKKMDPNSNDTTQMSVLQLACLSNNLDNVRLLITNTQHPANPNKQDKMGVIFHNVWCSENTDMISLLLTESLIKVNLDYTFCHHGNTYTPLTQAINDSNVQLMDILLKAGADPNLTPSGSKGLPLVMAVLRGNIDICRMLLELGCNYMSRYYAITTSLTVGNDTKLQIMRLLVKHGPDIVCSYIDNKIYEAIENKNSVFLEQLMRYAYNLLGDEVSWGLISLNDAICHQTESCAAVLLRWGFYNRDDFSFYLAADKGLVSTMKIIAELNPFCLQDDWLVDGEIPASILHHKTFTAELNEARKQPPRLDILCRSKIIQQLGYHLFLKAEELPLPRPLREFVQLRNVVDLHK